MIIYPAIDIRGGKVVRLKEGDPNHQTIFSDDPVATAQKWIDQGAEWLHVINLDGAFDNKSDNLKVLEEITKLNTPVQFGGGVRSLNDADYALKLGVSRVVMGTPIVQNPDLGKEAVERFGAERICIAMDAKHGKVVTHGWQQTSQFTLVEFGKLMAQDGIIHALYTDVHRDGSLIGVNIHETVNLAIQTGLKVIASGGVSTAEEISQLAKSNVIAGAIIGMALYEEKIMLVEALMAARNNHVS